jgi:hypothetical protein
LKRTHEEKRAVICQRRGLRKRRVAPSSRALILLGPNRRQKMLGKPERIVILDMTIERMNLSATAPCPWKSGVWTSVSSAPHPLFRPSPAQIPDSVSDRARCGGRESNFPAAVLS